MLKKLDTLIIKAFIGPFIATFFITLMVLVMQFFWLYVDDFVGKGLGAGLIFEFIWYQSAVLVPLALPLAVLLSSLMTFGNLGESYELVAIRSAGISLLRFMRPLVFVTLVICGIAFSFSNNVIPVAQLKSRTMLADIVYAKPAFDLREGVFYDKISGFAIKIGQKQQDSIISDIIIYEQSSGPQDNFIVASDGIMRVTGGKRFLEFHLRNGWRFEERASRVDGNTEYIRLGFEEYKKQFDLSSFQFQRTSDSVNRNNARMLTMRQLSYAIDSIGRRNDSIFTQAGEEAMNGLDFYRFLDSNWVLRNDAALVSLEVPDSLRTKLNQRVSGKLASLKVGNDVLRTRRMEQARDLRLHEIEWHRKLALSAAPLVLFLIGAPLGSIIRKGGLGTPMIFAIVFFMLFYFTSTTGEKYAKEGGMSPWAGMWISTFLLLPIGAFLTYKAMRDAQLFSKEWYGRLWGKLKRRRFTVNSPQ